MINHAKKNSNIAVEVIVTNEESLKRDLEIVIDCVLPILLLNPSFSQEPIRHPGSNIWVSNSQDQKQIEKIIKEFHDLSFGDLVDRDISNDNINCLKKIKEIESLERYLAF